jgi:acyl-CoA thioester hydrolase
MAEVQKHLKFEWEFTVLEIHLDTFGHMNHAVYLQLFEQARWEFIRKRGYGIKEIQEKQIGPTILELNIKYKRELRIGDVIRVESETIEFASKIGKVRQHMINKKGDICSTIELTLGLFDMKARRLISPTPEWLHAVGVIPNNS